MGLHGFDSLAQYGIGVLALGILTYVITMFLKTFSEKLEALTKAIETNTKMVGELQELIRQQGLFIQRAVERLDALWDISIKKV